MNNSFWLYEQEGNKTDYSFGTGGETPGNCVPVLVVNEYLRIVHTNRSFTKKFPLEAGDRLASFRTEPELDPFLREFLKQGFNYLETDISILNPVSDIEEGYSVEIERIKIDKLNYIYLRFKDLNRYQHLEEKIENIYSIIEIAKIPVLVFNNEGVVTFSTAAFENILSKPLEDIYKRSIIPLLYEYIDANDQQKLIKAIHDETEQKFIVPSSDGSEMFEFHLYPIKKEYSNSLYFILTAVDITEHIKIQNQLKKAYETELYYNKLKNIFLENMSHEIRTPYNALIGYSDIIEENIKDNNYEETAELLDSLKEVLGRVLNLFMNIVEVAQLESGEVELERDVLNCSRILSSVYHKKLNSATKRMIDFTLEFSEEELLIETDWIKLENALLSIVDNSIKYTHSGYVLLKSEKKGDRAVITVKDTGKGMELSKFQNLVKPFVQEEEGYTRYYEGAGLGLTIAYKYVKMLDGEFYIESKPGEGTEIRLEFKLSQ